MDSAPPAPEESYASVLARVFLQEDINFLLTNRLPRRYATKLIGWFSRIESRRLTALSLRAWQLFADDLRLEEAATDRFGSLHECFTRALKPGARPIDPRPDVLVSPCDAVVGAHGRIAGTRLIQAKGFPYTLEDLLGDDERVQRHRHGLFVTLRLKANMYHRFHAPCDASVERLTYVSGDTWNVNPIALRRVERLFCKNERAIVDLTPDCADAAVTLVPVAAILVGSIRFNGVETPLTLAHRGRREIPCAARVRKGEELGRFEAGSTILLFVTGPFRFDTNLAEGVAVRVGEPLFHRGATSDGEGRHA